MSNLDERSYERTILDPARRARRTPVDLAVRYGIDPAAPLDDGSFDRQLDQMRAYWQRIGHSTRRYENITAALLVEHGQVEAELAARAGPAARHGTGRYTAFLAVREERLAPVRRQLVTEIRRLSAERGFLIPQDIEWLADYGDGAFDQSTVESIARAEQVPIRQPPVLTANRAAMRLGELRSNVRLLGLALAAEMVFGRQAVAAGFVVLEGFRLLSGTHRRVTAELIAQQRERAARMGHQEPRTVPTRNVLSILAEAAADPQALDDLLRAEVVDVVRDRARGRHEESVFAAVAEALGVRCDEARLIAVSLAQEARANPRADLPARIDQALAEGELRAAQRLCAQLGAGNVETTRLRDQVERRAAQVAALTADAAQADAAGDTEAAALALSQAVALASDDEGLQRRLLSMPPPPPGPAGAELRGQAVIVHWLASSTRVGRVRYRVTRTTGSTPGPSVPIGQTDEWALTDPDPPVGEQVRYAVFAARDGGVWSAPTLTGGVLVTPEISDPRVHADEQRIEAHWTPRPQLTEVVVARRENSPPDPPDPAPTGAAAAATIAAAGIPIQSGRAGFVDQDVVSGPTYYYRVCACYLVAGRRVVTPGVVLSARLEKAPRPVERLDVDIRYEGPAPEVRLGWVAPDDAAVVVYASQTAPGLRGLVAAHRIDELGVALDGQVQRLPDGHVTLVTSLPVGRRHFLTAATRNGSWAMVGCTVEVTVVAPVRELAATRLGNVLRLAWAWPPGAIEASVTWRDDRDEDDGDEDDGDEDDGDEDDGDELEPVLGQRRCSPSRYAHDNGLEIVVGTAPVVVRVEAIVATPDGLVHAPPATVRSAAPRPRVVYEVSYQPLRRDETEITVTFVADRSCELPPITVIRSEAPFVPSRQDHGTVVYPVYQFDDPADRPDRPTDYPRWLEAAVPRELHLVVAAARPYWLVCLAASGSAVSVEPRSLQNLWVK